MSQGKGLDNIIYRSILRIISRTQITLNSACLSQVQVKLPNRLNEETGELWIRSVVCNRQHMDWASQLPMPSGFTAQHLDSPTAPLKRPPVMVVTEAKVTLTQWEEPDHGVMQTSVSSRALQQSFHIHSFF